MKGGSGTKLSQEARSTQGILGSLLVLCSMIRENYSHSILQRRRSEEIRVKWFLTILRLSCDSYHSQPQSLCDQSQYPVLCSTPSLNQPTKTGMWTFPVASRPGPEPPWLFVRVNSLLGGRDLTLTWKLSWRCLW